MKRPDKNSKKTMLASFWIKRLGHDLSGRRLRKQLLPSYLRRIQQSSVFGKLNGKRLLRGLAKKEIVLGGGEKEKIHESFALIGIGVRTKRF